MSVSSAPDTLAHVESLGRAARAASRRVATLSGEQRSAILNAMADAITAGAAAIETANARDLDAARERGLAPALVDRLRLDTGRIASMADGVRQVAALPDPLGRALSQTTRPNGLVIRRVTVPIGVVLMIYEARPNVTADAAALCVAAGSAVILRGGSEARASNEAILAAMRAGGVAAGLPDDAIQLVGTTDRAAVHALLARDDLIDLAIPRGGEQLIRAVAEHARVPVLRHYTGVCHVYVDRAADLEMARRIAVNAKVQRPGVCNAMETLLVHEAVAEAFLPAVARELVAAGVELRGDERTCGLVPTARPAEEADWPAEYLDLILAVRVVPDLETAVDHIARYGSQHTDVIVTADSEAADRFTSTVDSATVCVNASSRFADGFEFGLGAEIGIATGKLHARGPCGLEALTTYKWVVEGTGQVRG